MALPTGSAFFKMAHGSHHIAVCAAHRKQRNNNTGEFVEFEASGDKIEAVYMIPGWTHNIINLSDTENLVTVMTCNEIFDKEHPDTFFEIVKQHW